MLYSVLLLVGFLLSDERPAAPGPSHEWRCTNEATEISDDIDDIGEVETFERRVDEARSSKEPECPRGPGYQGITACVRAAHVYCEARGSKALRARHEIDYKLGGVETCKATCADGQIGVGRSGGES